MSGDDAQQLQNMPEVCFIAAPLSLQRQQEVSPIPYSATLILIDDVHKQEGEDAHITVCEVSADDVEHAVQRVQTVCVVHRLLWPRVQGTRGRRCGLGRALHAAI